MRFPAALLCCGLAACSSFEGAALDPVKPPEAAAIAAWVKQTAKEAKLPDPLEVSSPSEAAMVSPGPWMVCMRSGAPDQRSRYAIFFKNNDFLGSRLAVRIDGCAEATFAPLPP
jgi:hypothetical protein